MAHRPAEDAWLAEIATSGLPPLPDRLGDRRAPVAVWVDERQHLAVIVAEPYPAPPADPPSPSSTMLG